MNTYMFITVNKSELPELTHTIQADDVEEAIRAAEYYPYCFDDITDMRSIAPDFEIEDFEKQVFDYYGLGTTKDYDDMENGRDGKFHIITCVPPLDDKDKVPFVFPSFTSFMSA